jgi:putative transcriptional regulator
LSVRACSPPFDKSLKSTDIPPIVDYAYGKNQRADLSAEQCQGGFAAHRPDQAGDQGGAPEQEHDMSKAGDMILEGLAEALAHARGEATGARETTIMVEIPKRIDVRALRERLQMSRPVFAARFGFSVRTLQKWETGERQPEGPARAYLTVIDRNPAAVVEALSAP